MRIGNWNHHQVQCQTDHSNNRCTEEIGPQKTLKAHTPRQNRNDLGLIGHFRREENNRNKCKQATELVNEEGNKIDVISKGNFRKRGLQLNEVIDLFGCIENNHDDNDQGYGKNVSSEELTHDVTVEYLDSRKFQFHSLRDSFSTMTAFHSGKVPCKICLRASPTSHK